MTNWNEPKVTLQVPVGEDTHKRLSKFAAMLGVDKTLIYRKAMDWASRNKEFKEAMKLYCEKEGIGW